MIYRYMMYHIAIYISIINCHIIIYISIKFLYI